MTKRNDALLRRGVLLEYATLGWNVLGAGLVLRAAIRSHSVALAGFGLDSIVEIGASVVVLWQLQRRNPAAKRRPCA